MPGGVIYIENCRGTVEGSFEIISLRTAEGFEATLRNDLRN